MGESEEVLQAKCRSWLADALSARRVAGELVPAVSAPPTKVSENLLALRAWLDRVEIIYLEVLLFRSSTRRGARDLEAARADAWDRVSSRQRKSAVGDRYQSGDQHRADVNLEIVTEALAARTAARLAELADDTARQVELLYRGIDGMRHDLNSRLRYLQWEKDLER